MSAYLFFLLLFFGGAAARVVEVRIAGSIGAFVLVEILRFPALVRLVVQVVFIRMGVLSDDLILELAPIGSLLFAFVGSQDE